VSISCCFLGIFGLDEKAAGAPIPQSGSTGSHGQPQAGSSPSTPGPGGGGSTGGAIGSGGGGGATGFSTGAAGAATFGLGGGTTGGGAGGGAAATGTGPTGWKGATRRGRGWRDWRRGDPTLIKGLWKSKGPLGNEFTPFFPACDLHCCIV